MIKEYVIVMNYVDVICRGFRTESEALNTLEIMLFNEELPNPKNNCYEVIEL